MVNIDIAFEIKELKQAIVTQNKLLQSLLSLVDPKDDMWDDQDMVTNWKVSKRTLASWRAKGIIGYVQVGNKIWYPREARDAFVAKYINEAREGVPNGQK